MRASRFRRRVIVSGLPRSGTSWVGRVLSFAPDVTYLREPDNGDHVAGARDCPPYLYLPAGADDAGYRRHLTAVLDGRVRTPFTMDEDPGPWLGRLPPGRAHRLGGTVPSLYRMRGQLVVKLVRSNLTVEWLAEQWPQAQQVVVMRHPCGQFASWRRQGWDPQPARLLADERLVRDHLGPVGDVIAQASTFWERAGALWGALWTVLHHQVQAHPDWHLVQHEGLCEAPADRFHRLYERVGLSWTGHVDAAVRELDAPQVGNDFSLRRSARTEADKWRRQLEPREIAECRRVTEAFDLPYYPDFEPVATTPS